MSTVREEGTCTNQCDVTTDNHKAAGVNKDHSKSVDNNKGHSKSVDNNKDQSDKDLSTEGDTNTCEPPAKKQKVDTRDSDKGNEKVVNDETENTKSTIKDGEHILKGETGQGEIRNTASSEGTQGDGVLQKHSPMPLFYYNVQKQKFNGYPK